MIVRFSLFDNKWDATPKPATRTWPEMCKKFALPQIRSEKDGLLFSPATFSKPRRLNENVMELSMLVLDCDHNATFEGIVERLRQLKCAWAVYSTYSHLRVTDSNPNGEPRFRAVLPLETPVPAETFPALWRWTCFDTGIPADEQAKDPSRMYYTPVKASADSPYQYHIEDGELLDWRELDLSLHAESATNASEPHYAHFEHASAETYTYHEDRHAELTRRIMSRGRLNSRGHYDARCLAHNGNGQTGLAYFPESGAVKCNAKTECNYFAILRAEGLPDGHLPSREKAILELASNNSNGSEGQPLDDFDNAAPTWPVLDAAAYHGLAGDVVRTIEPETESDVVAILLQVLVWFGNCIGRSAYFQVEADRHYPNLSAVLVGASSKARKGTSAGQVRKLFEAVDEEWANNRVQGGLSSGEGLIWAVRDPIEEKQPVKKAGRVIDYETVIKDHGIEDKRLLVVESEFASVLRVMSRDGNTLSPVIRQAWDSGRLRVMTKNSPAKATAAHISIVGHITVEELRRNLDQTETANGFANRILWSCVRRSKFLPEGGQLISFNSLISSLHAAVKHAKGFSGRILLDDEARDLWYGIYEELSAGDTGLLGSVTSRAEAQVIRLATIYALLDCSDFIRVDHLRAGQALWQYCHASAAFIFGRATGDRAADTIADALREAAPDGLTRTEISNLLGRNKDAEHLNRSLATLQEHGLVRAEQEQTEGRPRMRYFYVRATKKTKLTKKGPAQYEGERLNSFISFNSSLQREILSANDAGVVVGEV